MNQKRTTILLITFFIFLMIGASFLYRSLSDNYQLDSLVVEKEPSSSEANTVPDNSQTSSENVPKDTETTTDTSSQSSSSEQHRTSVAPNFTVYDIAGNQINLSDFFGKPIVLNFWASWCGPCQMEMPDFNDFYKEYQNEITFLMVNMTDGSRETIEIASSFIAEKGYLFPVYYDTDYSAAISYGVTSLPTTYFIDSDGNLIAHAKGAIDAETLQMGIDMIHTSN